MPTGKNKDGSPSKGWNNLQNQREKNKFRLAGLPAKLLRKPQETYEKGLALVELIKRMEVEMTEWEDKQPLELLELLPWWEARLEYRKQKALGYVPEVQWWEAIAFVEAANPSRLVDGTHWGFKPHAPRPPKKEKLP